MILYCLFGNCKFHIYFSTHNRVRCVVQCFFDTFVILKYHKAKSATLMIIAAKYHTSVFNVSKFFKIVD